MRTAILLTIAAIVSAALDLANKGEDALIGQIERSVMNVFHNEADIPPGITTADTGTVDAAIVRLNSNRGLTSAIFSYKDAQGFRKSPNEKLRVKLTDAEVFHYGYVKEPVALQLKQTSMIKHYHDDKWIRNFFQPKESYQYEGAPEPVKKFEGTHPAIMKERIERKNWPFTPYPKKYASNKDKFKRLMLKWTGWYPGEYRNYKSL